MKIVHISMSGPYTDNFSYQENLLSKYHVRLGYEVTLIASEWQIAEDGSLKKNNISNYINNDGVKIIRLPLKGRDVFSKKIKRYYGLFETLEKENPDIIFHHGCQSVEESTVIKYIQKHPLVKLFVDNHADFSNSARNWISKNILHKILWRYYAKKLNPYVRKFYGVLPARVKFLLDMYQLPEEKVDLLVMGADDELVESSKAPEVRIDIRKKYGIDDEDLLIITGGKIDEWKKQTLLLMDAINEMEDSRVKLIVFGSVIPELKDEIGKRCSGKVQYIGWIQSEDIYRHVAASDLAIFPGRHSVLWEQVVGQGIPMIVKYWDGTTHVDCGGNVLFLYKDDIKEIKDQIEAARNQYVVMSQSAKKAKKAFSYYEIAKKSIQV